MTGADVVAEARQWIGTPYHHQAAVRGVGCDCAGLVLGVAKVLALTGYRPTAWGRQPNSSELADHLAAAGCVPVDAGGAGRLVQFALPGDMAHLGICSDSSVIHSWVAAGGVCEMAMTAGWARRVRQYWALPGVEA